VGNVFTPQVWFRYGSPQSMVLLTLKRFVGTRNVSVVDIPRYMDEMDELEDIYFGKKRIGDSKEKTKLMGLYKYCSFMKPPESPGVHVPYNLIVSLAKVAPKGSEASFIIEKLRDYRYVKGKVSSDLKSRIGYALNWAGDFEETTEAAVELNAEERTAVGELVQTLPAVENAEEIQSVIFEIARRNKVRPKRFFNLLYSMLLGTHSGPRLGPYLIDMGKENAIETLRRSLQERT